MSHTSGVAIMGCKNPPRNGAAGGLLRPSSIALTLVSDFGGLGFSPRAECAKVAGGRRPGTSTTQQDRLQPTADMHHTSPA